MGRVIALDVGDKTIGVAMSDELGIVASPMDTIMRTESIKADLRAVVAIIDQYEVSHVVVGMPYMLSGEEAVQAEKVKEFAEKLAKRIRIPLTMWDERFTTVEAERALIEAGKPREKRKAVIDKIAAALILRAYLQSRGFNS